VSRYSSSNMGTRSGRLAIRASPMKGIDRRRSSRRS
jgi:hypothetical protein